jgi:hypothetical protein
MIHQHFLSIKKLSLMTKKQTEHTLSKTDETYDEHTFIM